ncbi:MAG: DUF445 family protein [Pseudomonadota bacterium]
MRHLQKDEALKLRQARRVKTLATVVLFLCFCLLVAAKILEHHFPGVIYFAIIAAFAEAATIGGIADWYAVVALFKRPLNLPIPHTAIIPNNRQRIASNLGSFIEENFLKREQIEPKLKEIDFAGEMAHWLSSKKRSRNLSSFLVRFVPQLLDSIDEKSLVRFASERVTKQLAQTDISPLVSSVMETFTKDGRHQRLLDEIISALHRFLDDEETLAVIREKVQQELPRVFNLFRADSLILNRIMKKMSELLNDIKEDESHPMRAEFETFLKNYVERTRRSRVFKKRVEDMKQQVLARPELTDAAEHLWANMRDYVLKDAKSENSVLAARLGDLFVDVGTTLKSEPKLKRDINSGMVTVLSNLVDEQRQNISAYVTEQVQGWDMDELVMLIEMNVGKDLQYIRFNGMLIGGFVGICLYVIERALLH